MKYGAPRWIAELKYDKKAGVFEYSACKIGSKSRPILGSPGPDKIIILEGDITDVDQAERNRARAFVRRLVDTLNEGLL